MHKLIVLTDRENADGFRLAGTDVLVAESTDDARRKLSQLLDDDSSGIIAVNQSMMSAIDQRMQQKIDRIYRPIVVSLPVTEKLTFETDHRAYLSRLIRRAIGFDITLRRG